MTGSHSTLLSPARRQDCSPRSAAKVVSSDSMLTVRVSPGRMSRTPTVTVPPASTTGSPRTGGGSVGCVGSVGSVGWVGSVGPVGSVGRSLAPPVGVGSAEGEPPGGEPGARLSAGVGAGVPEEPGESAGGGLAGSGNDGLAATVGEEPVEDVGERLSDGLGERLGEGLGVLTAGRFAPFPDVGPAEDDA